MSAFDVRCSCGAVHGMQVGDSTPCQCGATLSLRKDSVGYITPWASGATGAPHIVNKPKGWNERQIYYPQLGGE